MKTFALCDPHQSQYFAISYYLRPFIAATLTEEKNTRCEDGNTQKPEVSLKEDLLEILDCCLNHEERVTEVERRVEAHDQHIRYAIILTGTLLISLICSAISWMPEIRARLPRRRKRKNVEEVAQERQ